MCGLCGVVCGTLGVRQPPEHVGVEIEAGKIKEEQTIVKLRKLGVEGPAMLGQHGMGLLQIFLIVENARGERLCVFGDSLSVVFANLCGEIARVAGRSRDGQGGIFRIDIDGRNVELKTRMRLLQIETTDAFDIADYGHQLELYGQPTAPLALFENEFVSLEIDSRNRFERVNVDSERLG